MARNQLHYIVEGPSKHDLFVSLGYGTTETQIRVRFGITMDPNRMISGATVHEVRITGLTREDGSGANASDNRWVRCARPLVVVGGEPLEGPRHMWWNFVHSDPSRIVQASADWEAGRFASVPGETEFIPLPEKRFVAAPFL